MSQAYRTVVKIQGHFDFGNNRLVDAKSKKPRFSRIHKSNFTKYPSRNYFECPQCGARFPKKSALMRHINAKHKPKAVQA